MSDNKSLLAGTIILSSSLLLCAGFSYWLVNESEAERAQRFNREYDLLLLQNKHQQAGELFMDVLSEGGDAPLDEVWLPFVLMQTDGYAILTNYSRILAGNPDREATYEEISNLIINAPRSFHDELKGHYFAALIDIPQVRLEWLQKYGLVEQKQ